MFTGIIEERGEVQEASGHLLVVGCAVVTSGSEVGASVAVNGVCLTVVEHGDTSLVFELSDETIERSSLRRLSPGHPVNLERPVSLAARLGGHIVQGHVDGAGEVLATDADGAGGMWLRIEVPARLRRYAVDKGSITVDGVSLTVAALHDDGVTIALIPHTLAATTLGTVRPGDPINLEMDVIAKYVERLMEGHAHD